MCLILYEKNFVDKFPFKNSRKQVLEYAVKRVQAGQNGLKLNGTHHLLVSADDVNLLDGSIHSIKKNTEAS